MKSTVDHKTKAKSPTSAKVESTRASATKVAPSPTQTRINARKSTVTGTPARSTVRKTSVTTSGKAGTPKTAAMRIFSPVRDPLGNSMGPGDMSGM